MSNSAGSTDFTAYDAAGSAAFGVGPTHQGPDQDGKTRRVDPGTTSSGVSSGEVAQGDLVLLIHGTFAGRAEDEGSSWWQKGSPAWQGLAKRLPAGSKLPERGEIFHWSGENSERARIKAANDLLERLRELEKAGRGYHLVGHSHGGSVIWHTLRLATLRQKKLEGLRTWTTVGTPFLHYRTRHAWSPMNLVNMVLALILLKPACNAFAGFFGIVLAAALGSNPVLELRSNREVGPVAAVLRIPVLHVMQWAGVPLVPTGTGLRLGSYDPSTGRSLLEYLFGTSEGWAITLVILLAGYLFLILASMFFNPVLESLRIRAENRLERTAMRTYRGRWLGLWSADDEAINGLRATLALSVSFVAEITPRDRILLSDCLSLLWQPYNWMLAPVFNRLVRPLLDHVVHTLVVKTAQGNNRPAAEVIDVSPYPAIDPAVDSHPSLPAELDTRLVDRANQYARDIAPKLRSLLAEPCFVAGLERFEKALSGKELIHTSYFDHASILDLIGLHLAWGQRDRAAVRQAAETHEDLWNWFCQFKQTVGERAETLGPPRRALQIRLVRTRPHPSTEIRG
ncbi:MAG: lipase family protein [Thermoguttaceae bacterium]